MGKRLENILGFELTDEIRKRVEKIGGGREGGGGYIIKLQNVSFSSEFSFAPKDEIP